MMEISIEGKVPESSSSLEAIESLCQHVREELNRDASTATRFVQWSPIITILLAKLRTLSTLVCQESRAQKQQCVEARERMDLLYLDLQNLFYEQHHLQLDLHRCRQLVTSYQNIALQNEDSIGTELPEDAHERMIARLRHELNERRRLLSDWTELNQLKEAEIEGLKRGNEVIEKIDAQYDALLKSTLALKKVTGYEEVAVDQPMLDQSSEVAVTPPADVLPAGDKTDQEEEEDDEGEIKMALDES